MNLKAVKNLFKLWLKFEDVLDTFQPPSRRGNANTYCRPISKAVFLMARITGANARRMFNRIDACKNMDEMSDSIHAATAS